MTLLPLTAEDAEQIRVWRNEQLQNLRTPQPLTAEQQARWYRNMIDDNTQYWWGIFEDNCLIGYCGIQKIDWISRNGEISMLFKPGEEREREALILLATKINNDLNLSMVYGETYRSNTRFNVWLEMIKNEVPSWDRNIVVHKKIKYFRDVYYDAYYWQIFMGE
jgi:RimJ/RimL family protein N-acetyltransferase